MGSAALGGPRKRQGSLRTGRRLAGVLRVPTSPTLDIQDPASLTPPRPHILHHRGRSFSACHFDRAAIPSTGLTSDSHPHIALFRARCCCVSACPSQSWNSTMSDNKAHIQSRAGLFAGAALLRLALFVLFPSLPGLLTDRVEISTPVNSFKRCACPVFFSSLRHSQRNKANGYLFCTSS